MAADYDPYEWWDDYDEFDHDLEFVEPGLDDYDFDDFYDDDYEDDESDSPILSDLAYSLDDDSEWMLDDELSHLDIEDKFMSPSGNFNLTRSNDVSRGASGFPSDSVRLFGEARSHASNLMIQMIMMVRDFSLMNMLSSFQLDFPKLTKSPIKNICLNCGS